MKKRRWPWLVGVTAVVAAVVGGFVYSGLNTVTEYETFEVKSTEVIKTVSANGQLAESQLLAYGPSEEPVLISANGSPAIPVQFGLSLEIEEIADAGDCDTDHLAGPLHGLIGRLSRRTTRDGFDCSSRGFGFETTACSTTTAMAIRLDDHMADVTGIAGRTFQQAAIDHDATADPGAHHHAEKVRFTLGRAEPSFGERKCLRIEISEHRHAHHLFDFGSERKVLPCRDVDRRDPFAIRLDRACRADSGHDDMTVVSLGSSSDLPIDEQLQAVEKARRILVRVGSDHVAIEKFTATRHDTDGDLAAADIDCECQLPRIRHQSTTRRASSTRLI